MGVVAEVALWDVAIVGAGPAGSAAALALLQRGVERVCVVDAGRPPGAVAIGETIPPDARVLLDRLGVWREFLAEEHEVCFGSCSAWGSAELGYNDFLLNPHGHGWHLDRARFDALLRGQAAARGAVRFENARLSGVELGDGDGEGDGGIVAGASEAPVRLELTDEHGGTRTIAARFAIDASGPRGALARRLGAREQRLDRLTFLYGFFDATAARSSSRLTLLEAAEHGWWYLAALPGQRLAVALASDAELVRSGALAEVASWQALLATTTHVAERLQGCQLLPGGLTARAAPSFLLDRSAGPRWLAVGDAAATYDPLSGQGIYQALVGGLEAGEQLAAALDAGRTLDASLAAATASRFAAYLEQRNHFYALERRWPASAFWQRRQARTALLPAG